MTIKEALPIARAKAREVDPALLPVSYKDLGDHFGFFASIAKSSKAEVGSQMLLVNKKNRIATWRPIRDIGPAFVTSPTMDL